MVWEVFLEKQLLNLAALVGSLRTTTIFHLARRLLAHAVCPLGR